MAARGRAPGFIMPDGHRLKIQNSNILSILIQHVLGKREMSQTQVTAGIALLKKVMPDLTAVELSGEISTAYTLDDKLPSQAEWEAEHTKPATEH